MKIFKRFFYIVLVLLLIMAIYFKCNAGEIFTKIGSYYYNKNNVAEAQKFYEKSFHRFLRL